MIILYGTMALISGLIIAGVAGGCYCIISLVSDLDAEEEAWNEQQ